MKIQITKQNSKGALETYDSKLALAGLKVCSNVHDEFIVTATGAVTIEHAVEKMQEIMETSPPWLSEVTYERNFNKGLN